MPESARRPMSSRSVASTFDKTAELYERARPGWPLEALDHVIQDLGVDRTATVLDLGAGTGKLTRMLIVHWFDGELVLAEIARVLRPRGGLVLMWNEPDKPTEPSIAAAGALLNERGSSERQIDRYASGAWRKAFAGSSFEELNEARFEHRQVVDREQLLAYFASMSWIAVLPDEEREELLNEVRGLLEADAYTRFWRADVYWTRLAA
jgi:ubiquinone/menaquinone biosynthesis C-methylase UbiE